MKLLLMLAALAATALPASAQIGTPYCFGVSCPCANDDPFAGCGNLGSDGSFTTGALLTATGSSDVLLDDLTLTAAGMQASQFGLFYMGSVPQSLPFGDGLRCAGGDVNRFGVKQANGAGSFSDTGLVAQSQSFPMSGQITAGSTWYFQGWYRDPGGPCGSQFNLTNAIDVTFTLSGSAVEAEIAGEPLGAYPFIQHVRIFNEGSNVSGAVDPTRYPFITGETVDIYVVAAKTAAQWAGDTSLTDVRGGPLTMTFNGATVQANTFVVDTGTLNGTNGTDIGIGYDLVIDIDQNGSLGAGDMIDGLSDEAGFYVVRDVVADGPYTVVEALYSGGSFLGQDLYYPSNIASLGQLPLIVVSHGNGHNYQWYDHIGFHMASYGYIVMSHQNNTGPGIQTASTTTLTNTEYILANQGTIQGGVLNGHIDVNNIVWIGHSRGGEGVARAYDRIFDGTYVPTNFTINDIQLVSSIAPTDFLGTSSANPHGVDYHLWTGSADADVSGSPSCDICQTYHLLERATGRRWSTTIQGAGHAVFHDGGGSFVASGPCLNGPAKVHKIMKGYFLPLVRHVLDDDIPSKDFLWRQWEAYKPIGHPTAMPECIVVNNEHKEAPSGGFEIDDYQTQTSTGTSSSGGAVSFSVSNVVEGILNDNNTSFTWLASDPMNGMTRARTSDTTRGVVFDWTSASFYEQAIVGAQQDLSDDAFLSFRACQGTRHPNTIAALEDVTFSVTLRDSIGTTSSISIGAYGGGIEEPYQRAGSGAGAGWGNEFETIRIRLTDFLTNGSGLDLTDVVAVRFEFGGAGESPVGRLGLDDIVITNE